MALSREQILASIERAKELVAAAKLAKAAKAAATEADKMAALGATMAPTFANLSPVSSAIVGMKWNAEQQSAIDNAFYGRSFCLIGAAGTGKTTTLKAILSNLIEQHRIPPLGASTKHLMAGAPGVALISYTRRAVRNIAKQMPDNLKPHCITFHKLVEYEPQYYTEWDEEKSDYVNKMRFAPARNRMNPLPSSLRLIVVDESSMLSIDYFNEILAALPDPSQVQFIFLGDLNQLPPVYGQAILGKMLLELPIIELTQIYRQALESPIISCALAVKNNDFAEFNRDAHAIWGAPIEFNAKEVKTKTVLDRPGRGRVTLQPWKKVVSGEDAMDLIAGQLRIWMKDGTYDPMEDLVLCPWNKTSDRGFGTIEMNLYIADHLSKSQGLDVHEVIAGFSKFYFAIGDRLLIDKMEAVILDIYPNPRYLGKLPQPASKTLNRWGNGGTGSHANLFDESISNVDIDMMLLHASDVEDRTSEASHEIRVRFIDTDTTENITKSATLNATTFAYAITVHKAQGSECRKVFLLLHEGHAAMCSRELIYTAITRAAEELHIVMPPKLLAKAAAKPRIKGDTLADKLEFFSSRMAEKDVDT